MTTATLFVRMVRLRVAVTLWTFLLIGAAAHGPIHVGVGLILAMVAVASSYVVATTVNDVADRDIDRLNRPGDRGRPLVAGDATVRDLWRTNALALPIALAAAAAVGLPALGLTTGFLGLAYAYSLEPLRLSFRTWLAPLTLPLAYAVVPFGLGVVAQGGTLGASDACLVAGLYTLFLARISLKDFRDREGDAAFGKRTVLLAHGKDATCTVSAVALAVGATCLWIGLGAYPGLGPVVLAFAGLVGWMLLDLRRAATMREEQVAIGLAAKMGNGLLVTVLAWLVLAANDVTAAERLLPAAALLLTYATVLGILRREPDRIRIAYKP